MKKDKAWLLASIDELTRKMKIVVDRINLHIPILELPKDYQALNEEFICDGYHWLLDVFNHEYAECIRVRALVPESRWKMMEMRDERDLPEVKKLKYAHDRLRARLLRADRPLLFKRKSARVMIQHLTKPVRRKDVDDCGELLQTPNS